MSVGVDDGDRIGSSRNTGRIEIEVDLRRADKGRPIHSDAAGRGSRDVVRPTRTTGIGARIEESGIVRVLFAITLTVTEARLPTVGRIQAGGRRRSRRLELNHAQAPRVGRVTVFLKRPGGHVIVRIDNGLRVIAPTLSVGRLCNVSRRTVRGEVKVCNVPEASEEYRPATATSARAAAPAEVHPSTAWP